ncbi:hypothetical protein AAFF_G00341420 [Aldrovandia affinis]|uniref:Uncharacterized protein n=1 Tax=Aldrovandia affinis TaxID=143900 RepID=A0AAD7WQ79_9TELE|nr:hypothetical protein AAFF_G00341420 [Aldrovandia affinis]
MVLGSGKTQLWVRAFFVGPRAFGWKVGKLSLEASQSVLHRRAAAAGEGSRGFWGNALTVPAGSAHAKQEALGASLHRTRSTRDILIRNPTRA